MIGGWVTSAVLFGLTILSVVGAVYCNWRGRILAEERGDTVFSSCDSLHTGDGETDTWFHRADGFAMAFLALLMLLIVSVIL